MYMGYRHDERAGKLIDDLCRNEEGIAMASEVLITISKDEREQAWLRSREKYILDTQSNLSWEKKQGRAEEKLAIARKMKQAGRPFTEIAEFTGLDMETIQGL
jgi:predicted transposase/invertase (TIGR01784 family)